MATAMPNLPSPSKDGFSRILMIGTSLCGGGSALYLIVQLVRDEPDRAFKLLSNWGPGFLLAFFISFLVSRLMDKLLEGSARQAESSAAAIREVAVEMRSVAEATSRQALAMQTTADKDDRDKQEMQILIGVVNSKVEQSMAEMKLHGQAIAGTLEEIKRQNRALMRIEDALKINRPEESETR
jgi:hypothetical protein